MANSRSKPGASYTPGIPQFGTATKTKTQISITTKLMVSVALLAATGGFAAGILGATTQYTLTVAYTNKGPYGGGSLITSSPSGVYCTVQSGMVTSAPCGTVTVPAGTVVRLTVADNNSISWLTSWGTTCKGNTCDIKVSSNIRRTITFADAGQLGIDVNGAGELVPSPLSTRVMQGSAMPMFTYLYAPGTRVIITPVAAVGAKFLGWRAGSSCSSAGATCTVTLRSGTTPPYASAYADFNYVTLTTQPTGTGTGTVTCNPLGYPRRPSAPTFPELPCRWFGTGATTTLTAVPWNDLWTRATFMGWSGAGCSGTGTCTVTMTGDKTVSPRFDILYGLSVTNVGNGSGTVTGHATNVDVLSINCGAVCGASYVVGTTVTLTARPATGSTFSTWGGACANYYNNPTCTVNMNQAQSVTATFTPISKTLQVIKAGTGSGYVSSDPSGIYCDTTEHCSASFASGTPVTLTATPNTDSTFVGWSSNCTSGPAASICAVNWGGDNSATVTATFNKRATYYLSVEKGGTGSGTVDGGIPGANPTIHCGVTCSAPYLSGTLVTLNATANTGSVFSGWSGACTGTDNVCTVTMNSIKSVAAMFNLASSASNSLTVVSAGSGDGNVTSRPLGIDCGPVCAAVFPPTQVYLTATPAAGSTFTSWSSNCRLGVAANICIVDWQNDNAATVTATFTASPVTYSLSVNKYGSGTGYVNSDPAGIKGCDALGVAGCTGSFASGTNITLTAYPGTGTVFNWDGGPCTNNSTTTCTLTLNNNLSIAANFGLPTSYTLSVSKSGSGTVTSALGSINCGPVCSVSLDYGTSVTLTATPASGYTFAGWGGDCSGTGTCSFTMDAAKSVTASFTTGSPKLPPAN